MAFVLSRIFGGSQQPQPQTTSLPAQDDFDDKFEALSDFIAQKMGHGWIEDNRNRFGAIAEYLHADMTAMALIDALTTAKDFGERTLAAQYALDVLQNPERPDHQNITNFVEQCQRTDISMAEARSRAVINFSRRDLV